MTDDSFPTDESFAKALLAVAIEELPAILSWLRNAFAQREPTADLPTDAEVLEAFEAAFAASRARDDAWLAAHPES